MRLRKWLLGAAPVALLLAVLAFMGADAPSPETASAVTPPSSSCQGAQACEGANFAAIGENSCNGDYTCMYVGTNGGSVTIGAGACNGNYTCGGVGANGGSATIGAGSCVGDGVCGAVGENFNGGGSITIGANSCIGTAACDYAAYGGTATIGDNSCVADGACQYIAYNNGSPGKATIGTGSCNGVGACYELGFDDPGGSSIGDYSCNDSPSGADHCKSLPAGTVIGRCLDNLISIECPPLPTPEPEEPQIAYLHVRPDPQTWALGGAEPTYTYRIEGWVDGDSPATVDGYVAPVCRALTQPMVAGLYTIVCSGGVAGDYVFIYEGAVLTVTGSLPPTPPPPTPTPPPAPLPSWQSYLEIYSESLGLRYEGDCAGASAADAGATCHKATPVTGGMNACLYQVQANGTLSSACITFQFKGSGQEWLLVSQTGSFTAAPVEPTTTPVRPAPAPPNTGTGTGGTSAAWLLLFGALAMAGGGAAVWGKSRKA